MSTDKTCHSNPQVNCGDCRLSAICLPISLQLDDIAKLDEIVQRGRPLQKGEYLYRAGTPFQSIYAVRAGALKTLALSNNGEEQVTGFHLPGEILGVDGIANGTFSNSAIALETSAVCEIPFARIEELSLRLPSLQRHLFQLLSREITQDQQLLTLLSKHTAEQRIAALLLSISSRNQRRGLAANAFLLPMARGEIGNYLGLTIETVSRIFSRLQKQGILSVDKRAVTILNMDQLHALAN